MTGPADLSGHFFAPPTSAYFTSSVNQLSNVSMGFTPPPKALNLLSAFKSFPEDPSPTMPGKEVPSFHLPSASLDQARQSFT